MSSFQANSYSFLQEVSGELRPRKIAPGQGQGLV